MKVHWFKGRRFSEKDWYYLQDQTDMPFHYLKLVVWIFPLFLPVVLAWKSAAKQKQTKCNFKNSSLRLWFGIFVWQFEKFITLSERKRPLGKIQLENRGKMNLRIKMKSQQYHICYRLRKKMVCWEIGKEIHLQIGKKSPFKNWK